MAIKSIVEAVEARLVILGFKTSEDVFSFDQVPDSVINKSFRIEISPISSEYQSGNMANVRDELAIYIAYKVSKRSRRTAWKMALDDLEVIEKDIINAASIKNLTCDPILTLDRETSTRDYLEDYLISRVAFTVDYLRDL